MKTNVKFSFEAEFHDVMSAQFHFISFMFQVRKMAPSTSEKVHLPPNKLFLLFFPQWNQTPSRFSNMVPMRPAL